MRDGYGVCPVCNGTLCQPARSGVGTMACQNCGGQGMYGSPKGEVPLRPDGTPCKHEYKGVERGRCYTVYTCIHCNHRYDIDSGD